MSTSFSTLIVTGHTLTFEVRVPEYNGFEPARNEAIHRTRLGASLVSRLATVPRVAKAELGVLDTTGVVGGREVVWQLVWTPDEKPDNPPKALRIGRAADVTYAKRDEGFAPVQLHKFPTKASSPIQPSPTTAVYVFLDVCSPYPRSVKQLVPTAVGFVLVHLSNTDSVTDKYRELLRTFLNAVTKPSPQERTTVLLVGDRVLHALGFPITADRSWEAFADDCVQELKPGRKSKDAVEPLRDAFARFDHVVVRHNPHAAVHIQRLLQPAVGPSDPRQVRATLHYLVCPERQFSSHQGYVRGINDILGASIVAAVMRGDGIHKGIADGLDRTSRFDEQGYFDKDKGFAPKRLETVMGVTIPAPKDSDRWTTEVDIPADDADLRPARWSILDLHLRPERWTNPRGVAMGDKGKSLDRALQLGLNIVRFGLAKVQKDGLSAGGRLPAVTFKKLKVVDRQAFEDVFEIRGAMLGYLENFRKETSPLCLAMFGAPGGGKSFAVKQLAESLGHPSLELPALEVNVSQYDKPEELAWVFNKVRASTQGGKVPLVFFDEFDTTRDDRVFGWQQTFLAPMQDGKFGRPPDVIDYRHGIFVFVGGVNHSFDGITGRSRNRSFIEAKGPDFVSRLVRHLNVLGITQDDVDADDFTFVVRRAVLLRDHLHRFQPKLFREGEKGEAEVDNDVVAALLTVPRYRHGVRSLEAIVRTSRLHADRPRLHWRALPPDSQLDMHVDIAELQSARLAYLNPIPGRTP